MGCLGRQAFRVPTALSTRMLLATQSTSPYVERTDGVRDADGRSKTAVLTGSYDSAVIGDRFRLAHAPTVLTRTASVAPIGFTRLRSERTGGLRAKDVPHEAAFALHVILQPIRVDMWVEGKKILCASAPPGATFLFPLSRNPVPEFHTSFDILRFYISQASLDELSFDRGLRRAAGLNDCLGLPDPVMHGLATALLDPVEHANERSALFVDHIALAFHAHVTDVYGNSAARAHPLSGGLSPWQLRHALDFMVARLGDDPTIAQLAEECGLSSGYFARAFRRTMGLAPHQWLMRKRIERAKELLLIEGLGLADVGVACGFVDQSHFTRVFAKHNGCTPGQWRRTNRAGSRK
jgi:AraC family transcriptional regulator